MHYFLRIDVKSEYIFVLNGEFHVIHVYLTLSISDVSKKNVIISGNSVVFQNRLTELKTNYIQFILEIHILLHSLCPAGINTSAYYQQYIINIVANFVSKWARYWVFCKLYCTLCSSSSWLLPSLLFVYMVLIWIGTIKLCVKFIGGIPHFFSCDIINFLPSSPTGSKNSSTIKFIVIPFLWNELSHIHVRLL